MEHEQSEVTAFLAQPTSYPWEVEKVDCLETHGARVFLAGEFALKIKRAVSFDYMNFSTLDLRRRMLERELSINRTNAPGLYLDVIAITRQPGGTLALGGDGPPVEWALRMRRFEQSKLLASIARAGPLDRALAEAIADATAASHASAPIVRHADGPGRLLRDAAQIEAAFAGAIPPEAAARALHLAEIIRHRLGLLAPMLAGRARDGLVRRCHGDLHLANIVLWNAQPTLFDAIEFDETIATIDVLYDLAFLLMDLELADQRPAANAVLARYLWRTRRVGDLDALAALPVMIALRAAIRAMVTLQRTGTAASDAARYLAGADRFLAPEPARLIAIGGLSGSGKSTLAAALAPLLGAAPGALHLRSDLERKAQAGVEPTVRLPAAAYQAQASSAIYGALADQAGRALTAGHCVIVDAVYASHAERAQIAAVAAAAGVAFTGLWLTAPSPLLAARVDAREGDASDATIDVVRAQSTYDTGPIDWTLIDAGTGAQAVASRARVLLGLQAQS